MSLHRSHSFPPFVTHFSPHLLSPALSFHTVMIHTKSSDFFMSHPPLLLCPTSTSLNFSHISASPILVCTRVTLYTVADRKCKGACIMQLFCSNDAVLSRVVVMPKASQPWLKTWLCMRMHVCISLHRPVYICSVQGESEKQRSWVYFTLSSPQWLISIWGIVVLAMCRSTPLPRWCGSKMHLCNCDTSNYKIFFQTCRTLLYHPV